ncbi:MAG TPA: ABC transporter permease [Candidatus Woesebacteria bacterium]|nr:ABC transporter permease [Candidatus Woesebacteria bacterium]
MVLWKNLIFILMLYLSILREIIIWLGQRKLFKWTKIGSVADFISWLLIKMEKRNEGKVSKEYLIELAFRNMQAKRNRTMVTIGGMALGVGAIVFLVSLGYGLERMVISKVTKLNELRMADITAGQIGSLQMNDEMMEKIRNLNGVEEVVPLISMVSKIKYNGSVFDVMSKGIEEKYIRAMMPVFLSGQEFKDRDIDFSFSNEGQKVMGVTSLREIKENMAEEKLAFRLPKGKMVPIWIECDSKSELLGYGLDNGEELSGQKLWGEKYYLSEEEKLNKETNNDNQWYSSWVESVVPIWELGEEGRVIPKLDAFGQQRQEKGCLMQKDILIEGKTKGEVLGISSEEATLSAQRIATVSAGMVSTASANIKIVKDEDGKEWVEYIQDEKKINETQEVNFSGNPAGEAFISSSMLRLLGISRVEEAIGKVFSVNYIVPDGSVAGISGRAQSVETNYTIKGVVEDPNSNYYYFHLADAKRLGIKNYSQMTVVVKEKESLAEVRKLIETMGFKTSSAADTVLQIETIFGNLRLLLGLLGTIALAVASLGMFNTMTVSLLERTREVGVMKSMGMLSDEVKELFLAESLIMGIGGGTFGVILGFLAGKLLSLVLTSISVIKGQGAMDMSYLPWFFILFIIGISFLVGIITGWYPSKRARQISALNALRYE